MAGSNSVGRSDAGSLTSAGALSVAVVIPCFKVTEHILKLLRGIGPEVERIYCVDDACPEGSGDLVARDCTDNRVHVIRRERNGGVGAATKTGYRQAMKDGANVVIKLDGDGQMDPRLIGRFLAPIANGRADYSKGNRFFRLDSLVAMPMARKLGNAALSFLTKLSSGYWSVFDPANGYTAIHSRVLAELPLERISDGWFFESDMLFRLNTIAAVVEDVPIDAQYGDEVSNLEVSRVMLEFPGKHMANLGKRIFYNYFLRNFSVASLQLVTGIPLLLFGIIFGGSQWLQGINAGEAVTAGTVMLAALPTLVGVQLLLSFLSYDMSSQPRTPLHQRLGSFRVTGNIDQSPG